MKKYLPLFLLLLLIVTTKSFSQDTIRFMHYNVLNYPNSSDFATKNSYLIPIISYLEPDILEINEMNNDSTNADTILNSVITIGAGFSNYKRAHYTNNANSSIVNMLFYNADKFTLYSEDIIVQTLRDINVYKLYYNDPSKLSVGDTIFLTVLSAHFKASSGSTNETKRANQATDIMNYLKSLSNPGNLILAGDFNIYNSSEQAYVNLTTDPNLQVNFNDPINVPGTWHNGSGFSNYHTQCTRLVNEPDGGSSGGLDDRFDFILCNNSVINDSDRIQYIPNSYITVGQDGLHYNDALTSAPTNTSVPTTALVNALYNMSDHLPLIAEFEVDGQVTLPVDFLKLEANLYDNKVQFFWETVNEFNNNYFEVQRSNNGKIWENVEKTNSVGNTNEATNYQIIDSEPLSGISYYRLKIVALDGSHTFSDAVEIVNNENSEFLLFPNPSANGIISIIKAKNALNKNLEFFDIHGKLVKSIALIENKTTISTETLKKGVYFIQFGKTVKKLIIQ